MPNVQASVGSEGRNSSDDVKTVQKLLRKAGCDSGSIDGVCGPRTVAAVMKYQSRFLAHPDGRIDPTGLTWKRLSSEQPGPLAGSQWSGDSSRWSQQKKLLSLEPIFRGKVQMVLDSLRSDGFQPHVVYGWRSVAVQQRLFDEGKSKVHFSFHNAQKADGTPRSYAADIIDERWGWKDEAKEKGFWTALSKEAKAQGLVWGGDWAGFSDVAHIQGRQNSELSAVKRESGL